MCDFACVFMYQLYSARVSFQHVRSVCSFALVSWKMIAAENENINVQ